MSFGELLSKLCRIRSRTRLDVGINVNVNLDSDFCYYCDIISDHLSPRIPSNQHHCSSSFLLSPLPLALRNENIIWRLYENFSIFSLLLLHKMQTTAFYPCTSVLCFCILTRYARGWKGIIIASYCRLLSRVLCTAHYSHSLSFA